LRGLCIITILVPACVAYRPAPVELDRVAREIDARAAEPLDFAAAVRFAHSNNPTLKRLAAEARAAGLDVPATRLAASADTDEEDARILVDPRAIARLGPRGAAAKAAHARQVQALAALREEERRIAVAIAETFFVDAALQGRGVPRIEFDEERFARAGLASQADRERVAFARKAERAERRTIAAERAANLARLRSLLGLGPDADVELVGEIELPPFEPDRILRRPDLAVAVSRYYVADADFRRAVTEQYPSFDVGGEISFDGSGFGGLVALRIPVGARAPARAAGERREAARHAVEEALLEAWRQAVAHAAAHAAAAAQADAFAARAAAARTGYAAALRRLDVEPDAFGHAADRASLAVRTAIQARDRAVAAARARARYADAYGWPAPEEVDEAEESR